MGIIHVPKSEKQPERPTEPAAAWPAGSIWRSGDGSEWMVVWVIEQDHRLIWEQIKTKKTS